jgi:hypothetical protein
MGEHSLEQELDAVEIDLQRAATLRAEAVRLEAHGDGRKDRSRARALFDEAHELRIRSERRKGELEEIIGLLRAERRAEDEHRQRERRLVEDAVRAAVRGSNRWNTIGALPEEHWPTAWNLFRAELAGWLARRHAEAEAAAAGDGTTIPAHAAKQIADVEAFLRRPIPELIAETRERRDARLREVA